ncbi:MAG: hypothetical protein K0V04_32470 [Deltaproteobacteria bacterium]|nr:hypothetical protein [Deltaproteobacteria bacterium]
MSNRMSSGSAWLFGLGAAVVASLSGFAVMTLEMLGTIAAFAIIYGVVAGAAVKKTNMSKGGVVGVFIVCLIIGCIGYWMTSASTMASAVAQEVAKDPQVAGGHQEIADAAAGAAGGLAGALMTIVAFVGGLIGSLLGGLIPRK